MSPKIRKFWVLLTSAAMSASAMSVTLSPSTASPATTGSIVTWSASVSDAQDGTLWYRYRVRQFGGDYHMIRDFGPVQNLDWAATDHEGTYELEVTVMNRTTGESVTTSQLYQVQSAVTDTPVVNPTSNPLVFRYSAPPCAAGNRMRVQFQSGTGPVQNTPFKACTGDTSMNFFIAGLQANSSYNAWQIVDTGSAFQNGPVIPFQTRDSGAPSTLPATTVFYNPPNTVAPGLLLGCSLNGPRATDLAGNLVWYINEPDITYLTSMDANGAFWGIVENSSRNSSYQVIRKIDLTGRTLLETNAARVSDQLVAIGHRPIGAFHHDARTLPDGRIAALASVEQILAGVQGPDPVDILGDMIVVFDRELNVVWAWDSFDHLDVTRAAILGENCTSNNGACPPFYLAPITNDWTHGNSIKQTPDGNILYSARHQDMLYKINYNNGGGDGSIIWRLGNGGDFTMNSADVYPWFSHQHDAAILFSDPTQLLVFDNGNTRVKTIGSGHSRGQALRIDEQNRTVTPILNVDLLVYSAALGTAQILPDGNYNFDAGYQLDNGFFGTGAYSFEVLPSGAIIYAAHVNDLVYRWIRIADMYTVPPN